MNSKNVNKTKVENVAEFWDNLTGGKKEYGAGLLNWVYQTVEENGRACAFQPVISGTKRLRVALNHKGLSGRSQSLRSQATE